jgi:hypothetical protein
MAARLRADVGALRNQIELALFYDRRLVLR